MIKLITLCLLFAFAFSPCEATGCYSMECSNVRFLNVLPALGTANVTAGTNNQIITNAAPGNPTSFTSVNANRYQLKSKFLRGGSCVSQPHPLAEDKHYTLITKRDGNNLENVLVNDNVKDPKTTNRVLLRAGNFLSENSVITVSDQRSGKVLFRNLEYGEISNWKEINTADYTLVWTARNNGNNKRMILQGGNWTCCWRSSSLYVTPSGSVITSAVTQRSTTTKRSDEDAIVPEFIDLSVTENENENNNVVEKASNENSNDKVQNDSNKQ